MVSICPLLGQRDVKLQQTKPTQPGSDIVRPCDKLARYLDVYVHYNSQMCYGIVNITHITTNKQIWEGHEGVIIYVYA